MILTVMLIWATGQFNGSPTIIQGFNSLNACERSRSVIEDEYQEMARRYRPVTTRCVQLQAE